MNFAIEFLSQPWHWAVSGALLTVLMVLMLVFGEKFGISSSFETICSMAGGGRKIQLFNFNWRKQSWQLAFIGGAIIGGAIGTTLLQSSEPVAISQDTVAHLASMGIATPQSTAEGLGFVPRELFTFESLLTAKGFLLLVLGGFLIGFGTRWASGCTSGHAISGLSNLQLPSLIAVIGFFIGGLLMTHLFLPLILSL